MFAAFLRSIRDVLVGPEVRIREDSPELLSVQWRRTLTEFDRRSGAIRQDSGLVASFSLVDWVELRPRHVARDSIHWVVALHLGSHRQLEVGESRDQEEASIVTAHISTATAKPVRVRDDSGALRAA